MFEPLFMRLALVASIAAATSLGIIGVYLIVRRIVFFGLVLANAATVGAAVAIRSAGLAQLGTPPALAGAAFASGQGIRGAGPLACRRIG